MEIRQAEELCFSHIFESYKKVYVQKMVPYFLFIYNLDYIPGVGVLCDSLVSQASNENMTLLDWLVELSIKSL